MARKTKKASKPRKTEQADPVAMREQIADAITKLRAMDKDLVAVIKGKPFKRKTPTQTKKPGVWFRVKQWFKSTKP
jgi:hypothetical protein